MSGSGTPQRHALSLIRDRRCLGPGGGPWPRRSPSLPVRGPGLWCRSSPASPPRPPVPQDGTQFSGRLVLMGSSRPPPWALEAPRRPVRGRGGRRARALRRAQVHRCHTCMRPTSNHFFGSQRKCLRILSPFQPLSDFKEAWSSRGPSPSTSNRSGLRSRRAHPGLPAWSSLSGCLHGQGPSLERGVQLLWCGS